MSWPWFLYTVTTCLYFMLILIYHHYIKTQCSCHFIIGGKQDGQPTKAKTTEEKVFYKTWSMQPNGKLFCYLHFLYFLLLQNSNLINTESSCELSFCFQSFLITEKPMFFFIKKKLVLLLWSLLNFFIFFISST